MVRLALMRLALLLILLLPAVSFADDGEKRALADELARAANGAEKGVADLNEGIGALDRQGEHIGTAKGKTTAAHEKTEDYRTRGLFDRIFAFLNKIVVILIFMATGGIGGGILMLRKAAAAAAEAAQEAPAPAGGGFPAEARISGGEGSGQVRGGDGGTRRSRSDRGESDSLSANGSAAMSQVNIDTEAMAREASRRMRAAQN